MKEPLSVALSSLPRSTDHLSSLQLEVIEDSISLLQPLEDITTQLSSEKYPSVSKLVPLIRGTICSVQAETVKTTPGAFLKENIIKNISDRLSFVEKNKLTSVSTLLDPRFKKRVLETVLMQL